MTSASANSRSREYAAWNNMRQRCENIRCADYSGYGGRGIKVCAEWASYSAFIRDMGEAPEGFSLDRINNDLGYSAANCRWASASEQANNRRLPGTKSSRYRGVTFNRKASAWQVNFRAGGKSKYGGLYKNEDDAAVKYNAMATELGLPTNAVQGRTN